MRHRKASKHLGRDSSHRRAMFRNMVTSLFKYEQIETTDVKAKQLRPIAERMITLAKRGDLHARRQALAYMMDKQVTHRLFEEIKDRYLDRQGGYVRIVKKGIRKGDNAPISIVQLIPAEELKKKAKKKTKKPKAKEAATKTTEPKDKAVDKQETEEKKQETVKQTEPEASEEPRAEEESPDKVEKQEKEES